MKIGQVCRFTDQRPDLPANLVVLDQLKTASFNGRVVATARFSY